MTTQEPDVTFLEYVVKALVEHPSDVKVTRVVDEMGVLITLDVNGGDMGGMAFPRTVAVAPPPRATRGAL